MGLRYNRRTRIYKNYATNFQDAPKVIDEAVAWQWNRLLQDKSAKIVNLTCGSGKLLHFLKRMGYTNITDVSIIPEQVKMAMQVISDEDEANVLDWLESHPASFDLTTSFNTMKHFHKNEVSCCLDACHAAPKPGGRPTLQMPSDDPLGMSIHHGDFTHKVGFNPNVLQAGIEDWTLQRSNDGKTTC